MKRPLYYYEPKSLPVFDDMGNIVGYQNPPALPLPLALSEPMRVKSAPNELGLSGDPNNVTGYKATIDLLNNARELKGTFVKPEGSDDLSVMEKVDKLSRAVKSAVSTRKRK